MADESDRPTIDLSDRQDVPVDADGLIRLARDTLVGEGRPDVELSVSLVTEAEMAELHERYLDEPGPTDVLSFPLDDDGLSGGGPAVLGDVVICPQVAGRQREAEAEVRLLLVHGILHLLGHDHETDGDRAAMWALQDRYAGEVTA